MFGALHALRIAWAGPWTAFGLLIGVLGLVGGGRMRRLGGVVECWGGLATWYLDVFPLIAGASAVTFGHTVLGRSKDHLDFCRSHELIHVRQYERWGPLFVPAYLACWIVLLFAGRNPYLDNPFEREAFAKS